MSNLAFIDVAAAFEKESAPQDFVLPGLLAGTLGVLVAPRGPDKTFFALELAMALSVENQQANLLGLPIQKTGKVVYYNFEDDIETVQSKFKAIGQCLGGASPATLADMEKHLELYDEFGCHYDILADTFSENSFLSQMIADGTGARAIIIESSRHLHDADETNHSQMVHFVMKLGQVCQKTGAAILLLNTTDDPANRANAADLLEAPIPAAARWCATITPATKLEAQTLGVANRQDCLGFSVLKQNYSEPDTKKSWFQRNLHGVLLAQKQTGEQLRG